MMKKYLKRVLKKSLPILGPLFSEKCMINPTLARNTLEAFSPKPLGNSIKKNDLVNPICDLQIIVPAYNVENYLEECLNSILSQETEYTYRVVLIDDGSTDMTATIADKYITHDNVIVIHQENKGFSGARNTGLNSLFAKYIMFVDSDDELCPNAIESLLKVAFENDCDIVEGGACYLMDEEVTNCFSHPAVMRISTPLDSFHGQPWAKLFKTDCFKQIVFPEGFWFEDTIMAFLLYRSATNCFAAS